MQLFLGKEGQEALKSWNHLVERKDKWHGNHGTIPWKGTRGIEIVEPSRGKGQRALKSCNHLVERRDKRH